MVAMHSTVCALSGRDKCGDTGLFCCARTVGQKPSPWYFHSLWNNLLRLKKKFWTKEGPPFKNLGWTCFQNTVSFLSCVSVHTHTRGFLVFPGQSALHCKFRDPSLKWWAAGGGGIHTAEPHPPNLVAVLGRESPRLPEISINRDAPLCRVNWSS